MLAAYGKYEFHVVYQKVSQFIAVELSSIYHDVVKDRLYTDAANSHRRRSTQTALHRMVTGLCKMLSPILVFTADEAWEFVPGKRESSVHETNWQSKHFARPEEEEEVWKKMFNVREQTLPLLEVARQRGLLGKALEAQIDLVPPGSVESKKEELRELLNVSQLTINPGNRQPQPINVLRADGQKCERCWHWETDVGSDPEHPTICARCVAAVKENLAARGSAS